MGEKRAYKPRKPGGGRKKLKPEYDAGKNLKEQMERAVALYDYEMSLQAIGEELGLNPIKVRKLLITAGVYESDVAEKVQDTSYVFYVHPDEIEAITREFAAIGNNLNQIAAFFNSGGLPSHVMCENINHAISCIFEMREQVAEMAGKNYGNLKAHRK